VIHTVCKMHIRRKTRNTTTRIYIYRIVQWLCATILNVNGTAERPWFLSGIITEISCAFYSCRATPLNRCETRRNVSNSRNTCVVEHGLWKLCNTQLNNTNKYMFLEFDTTTYQKYIYIEAQTVAYDHVEHSVFCDCYAIITLPKTATSFVRLA
jgi:hypothetical protein